MANTLDSNGKWGVCRLLYYAAPPFASNQVDGRGGQAGDRQPGIESIPIQGKPMNTNHMTMQAPTRAPSWARFAGIIALYGLLGPLVGAVGVNALFTVLAIGGEVAKGDFGDIGRLLVGGMVVGTIISLIIAYTFGIASAAAVGLAVAFRDWRDGGISWRVALMSSLVVWSLTAVASTAVVPPGGRLQWIGALLIAHLLAAAICTWIARRLFR